MTITRVDYIYGCHVKPEELAAAYLKLKSCEDCEDEKCSPEGPCDRCLNIIYSYIEQLWLDIKYVDRDGESAFDNLKGYLKEIPSLPGSLVIRRFPLDYHGRDGKSYDFVIGILMYEQPSNHDGSFIKIRGSNEIQTEFAELRNQVPILKGKSPKCYFIPWDCICCS